MISIALAIAGVIHVSKGNALGYILLGCIVLHWTMYFIRKRNG